jgi:UPF0755 protein
MNDILPPKRPLNRGVARPESVSTSAVPQSTKSVTSPSMVPQDILEKTSTSTPKLLPPGKRRVKAVIWIISLLLFLIIAATVSFYVWYTQALTPVDANDQKKVQVEIVAGSTPTDIAEQLEAKKLIRSTLAFDLYTRLSNTRSKLQAGAYNLSPSESTEAIVSHLVAGKVVQLTLTFLPGATLADNKKVLLDAGYTEGEVNTALNKAYEHPLFTDKPADTDLEGYIWGDTYTFGDGTKVEDILITTFDHYYDVLVENDLITGFNQQNLNLFQGITLASVIQREVSGAEDQKKVAQVFFKRLSIDMPLGADATYKYAAKKLGVDPTPDLDSPYNTRKFNGLPPGPIATPGKTALQAVASPSDSDYLYFVSGDDDINYFSHTLEEHEENTEAHCQVKCSTL